jgi:hypothetical protein
LLPLRQNGEALLLPQNPFVQVFVDLGLSLVEHLQGQARRAGGGNIFQQLEAFVGGRQRA